MVCRSWRKVEQIAGDRLWRHLFGAKFGGAKHGGLSADSRDFQCLFREAFEVAECKGVNFELLSREEGVVPSRSGHTASEIVLSDQKQRRLHTYLILFGGATDGYQYTCDLDVFDCERSAFTLTAQRPSGITPSPRWLHSAGVRSTHSSYLQHRSTESPEDVETVEVWIFGGQGQQGDLHGDLHVLTLSIQAREDDNSEGEDEDDGDLSTSRSYSSSHSLLLEDMHWNPLQWSVNTNEQQNQSQAGAAGGVQGPSQSSGARDAIAAELRPTARAGHCCVMLQEQNRRAARWRSNGEQKQQQLPRHSSFENSHMLIFSGLAEMRDRRYGRHVHAVSNELWLLECGRIRWQQIMPAEMGGQPPEPRWTAACCVVPRVGAGAGAGVEVGENAFFDADVVVFGGWAYPESRFLNDVHVLMLRPKSSCCSSDGERLGGGPGAGAGAKGGGAETATGVDGVGEMEGGIKAVAGTSFTWSCLTVAPGPQPTPRCQSSCWWVQSEGEGHGSIAGGVGSGYLLVYGGACHEPDSDHNSAYGDRVRDLEDCWLFGFQTGNWLRSNSCFNRLRGGVNATAHLRHAHDASVGEGSRVGRLLIFGGMHSDAGSNEPTFMNDVAEVIPQFLKHGD